MSTDAAHTTEAVRLVLGVARLGENDLRGWWNGHALDRTGQYVMSSMFRRTWRAAALELDVAAAARMHNELLGRSSALHLFSDGFPFRRWSVGWLAEQKTASETDPLLDTLQSWTAGESIDTMRAWCGSADQTRGEHLGDGLLLGRLSAAEIADPATLDQTVRLLAATYLGQTEVLRPPYFDISRRKCSPPTS